MNNQELFDAIAFCYQSLLAGYIGGNRTAESEVGKLLINQLRELLSVQIDRARKSA